MIKLSVFEKNILNQIFEIIYIHTFVGLSETNLQANIRKKKHNVREYYSRREIL